MRKLLLALSSILALSLGACQPATRAGSEDTLLLGNGAEPLSLDPQKANGTWENRIIGDMFMGLTTEDPASQVIPGMAERWTTSKDGLVWTFHLRAATWSDGVPVTAEDFVFSFRRLMNPETLSDYASIQYGIKNAQAVFERKLPPEALGVKALDPKTLELTLEMPQPYLLQLLKHYTSFPLPRHVIEREGADWIKPKNIVTNGAYKLVRWRTNDLVEVQKNEKFWDAKNVCFKHVFYYPTTDSQAAERRVRAGLLDSSADIEGARLSFVRRKMPTYVHVNDYMGVTYYVYNMRKKPFDDVRVRRALSMAVDRDFLTSEITRAGQRPAYSIVPPQVSNYPGGPDPEWASWSMAKRREAARALLQSAGYGPNKPLNFTYSYRSGGDGPRVAPVLQRNWKLIAPWVNVTLQGGEAQLHYQGLRTGDYQVGDAGWIADFNDARNFLFLNETKSGDQNYAKYSNPEFDALLARSDGERDLKKRGALLAQAQQLIARDQPMVSMWFAVNKNLVRPDIAGWVDNVEDIHRTRFLCRKPAA